MLKTIHDFLSFPFSSILWKTIRICFYEKDVLKRMFCFNTFFECWRKSFHTTSQLWKGLDQFVVTNHSSDLPSGKLTVCYWKWPLISWFFPLNMVIFHSYVNVYQAGYWECHHPNWQFVIFLIGKPSINGPSIPWLFKAWNLRRPTSGPVADVWKHWDMRHSCY